MAKTGSLTVQLQSVFDDYTKEIKKATNTAADNIARQSVQRLRDNSPRKTGSYARGWAVKREQSPGGINTVIVHNKTDYQLTHLLENGHLIVNKKGTYGRVPGIKHIKPVEEWANDELPREIERILE